MTVSVCIPTYNGSEYLEKCLDSVITQTFENIEILILDDCSSDNTLEIANAYSAKDTRIQVLKNDVNRGLVGNWNKCIGHAQGEWIKFVFQDDVIEPDCIQLMVDAIQNDCPLVVCERDFIFENGVVESYQKFMAEVSLAGAFSKTGFIEASEVIQAQLKSGLNKYINFIGEPTSTLIRRDAFQTFGSFNTHLIQLCDLEFWLRIAVNEGLVYVPRTLVHFRVHDGSVSSSNSNKEDLRVILDDLILLGEIMTNPFFIPLLGNAPTKLISASLNEAGRQYLWLKNWACQSIDAESRAGAQFINNLAFFESNYPIICKHRNVILKQAYAWLDKKLLWRFR